MRVWLTAEEFGFGPVSKVCAVARELRTLREVEFVGFGTGIVPEFFLREGFNVASSIDDIDGFDCAIVGLSPELARKVSHHAVPFFYIDSLSFMWNKDYFSALSELRGLQCYISQAVFDAPQKVQSLAPDKFPWVSVGAVVDTYGYNRSSLISGTTLFLLGGMANPFNDGGQCYAQLIVPIIKHLQHPNGKCMVICSNSAAKFFDNPALEAGGRSHRETVRAVADAETVLTSPGLTTLLEVAALDTGVFLLPPQNLSQLIILERLAKYFPSNGLIASLLSLYPKRAFANEEDGVIYVAERNASLCRSGQATELYSTISVADTVFLRDFLCTNYNGARECALNIYEWSRKP